jgi:hypothetical protein
MPDVLDQLISKPGLYVGTQTAPEHNAEGGPSIARLEVTPLPGGSGVMMAYEVLSPTNGVQHQEHAILARTPAGLTLVTSHSHADVTTVLSESEPGYFPAVEGAAPFAMAIRLEVPEPGHVVYSWSYGWDQEPLKLRDIGDMRLVG